MSPNWIPIFIGLFASALCQRVSVTLGARVKNQIEMVGVPAGLFSMGSNDGARDERPQHRVELAAFSIDRTKVTNAQFAEFLNAIGPVGPKGAIYFDADDNDARVHRLGRSSKDGRDDMTRDQVRVTRGGGHDAGPEELTTTHRGRHVSRNPRGGHHNISFRCAR